MNCYLFLQETKHYKTFSGLRLGLWDFLIADILESYFNINIHASVSHWGIGSPTRVALMIACVCCELLNIIQGAKKLSWSGHNQWGLK